MIEEIINYPEDDLTKYIQNQLEKICEYLEMNTKITLSSQIKKNPELKGQDRIIEICKKEQADIYINPSGGRNLYDSELFKQQGIQLYFIDMKSDQIVYEQKSKEFFPNMSIIDILMNNDREIIQKFLEEYQLNER